MALNVTIEDAYSEACTALGESIVIQRLQAKELERLAQESAAEAVAEPEN